LPVDPPEVFERAGDLLDRSAAACALARTVRDLRQTWESFDRIGVGRAVLPEARPEVVRWRRFRDAWDSGELGDPSEPGWYARVGSAARALAEDANQILRAGLWGEDSPERERLKKIREILGQYKAKLETSGAGGGAGRTVQVLDQFTCPSCGSHEFGSVEERAEPLLLVRYCHGRAGERGDEACPFSWPDTDDPKYFTRRDLGTLGTSAAVAVAGFSQKLEEVAGLERDLEGLSAPAWHAPGDLGALELRVGALFDSGDAERIASLKARVATHDHAVAEQLYSLLTQDDIKEYVARWDAFKPLEKLEGDVFFHWSGDLDAAELKFNNFLFEFNNLLENRRLVEREKADIAAVEAVLANTATPEQRARVEELKKAGKYKPPKEDFESKATPVAVPPPAPPPLFEQFWKSIPLGAKAAGVAVLALIGLSQIAALFGARR
jgi:hypothetical protein